MKTTAASREELERLLFDDVPHGDITTEALGVGEAPGEMTFTARDAMTVALVEDAAAIIALAGGAAELDVASGDRLAPGRRILVAHGPAAGLLRSWKVAQTMIEIWSGVATAAREIVEAAQAASPDVVVACTRKHTPGMKRFAVAAVRAGGATMHRLGLSDTVLVFANHLAIVGAREPSDLAARLRLAEPERKIGVEVDDLEAGLAAAQAGFDVVQLDKVAPSVVARLVERLRQADLHPVIAAAGGINAANAADYAAAGAHVLVTSAPYTARPRDVKVRVARAGG